MYGAVAAFYDNNTEKADPAATAAFIKSAFWEYCKTGSPDEKPIMLDAACGTGACTAELARLGFDMIGLDISPEMLQIAAERPEAEKIRWIMQDMTEMDLFGTVQAVICTRDSINHLTTARELKAFLKRAALFTEKGGLLIFDAVRKPFFEKVVRGNVFCQEDENGVAVWNGSFDGRYCLYEIDCFLPAGRGLYERTSETIKERVWEDDEISKHLKAAGYSVIKRMPGISGGRCGRNDHRRWYICRKEKSL